MLIRKTYALFLLVWVSIFLAGCTETQTLPSAKKSIPSDVDSTVQENKQMDPYLTLLFSSPNDFALADGIFTRISNTTDVDDSSSLSREEAVVYDVWGAEGIIGNGGFEYLFESDIKDFERIAKSYEIIGVPSVAQAIRSALEVFPKTIPIDDVDERMAYVLAPEKKKRLEELSTIVYFADRKTIRQLGAYIRKNQQAFVDLKPTQWEDLNALKKKHLDPPAPDARKDDVITWLRSIDAQVTDWSQFSELPHISEKFTSPSSGNPIVSIELKRYRNTVDQDLERMSQYPALSQLRKTDLSDSFISQNGIKYLARFPNLESVDLSRTDVKDSWLPSLSQISSLKELNLFRTAITNAGLNHIAALTSLEHLDLPYAQITDEGLLTLAPLKELKTLNCSATRIGGSGLIRLLRHFNKLEQLVVDGNEIGDADLQAIGNLTKLQTLILSSPNVTDKGLAHLAGLKHLIYLSLDKTPINGSGFSQFGSMEHLEDLSLYETNVDDDGAKYLGNFSQLKRLSLTKTRVTNGCIEALSQLKQLESLSLVETAIDGGPELQKLEKLQALEHLSLPAHLRGNKDAIKLQRKIQQQSVDF